MMMMYDIREGGIYLGSNGKIRRISRLSKKGTRVHWQRLDIVEQGVCRIKTMAMWAAGPLTIEQARFLGAKCGSEEAVCV